MYKRQDYRGIVGEIRRDYAAKGASSDYSDNQTAWGRLKNEQTKGKPVTTYVDNLLNDPARGGMVGWRQKETHYLAHKGLITNICHP